MPAPVELDGWLEGDLTWNIVGGDGSGVRPEGVIEVIDVCLMMLAVVQLHDLG